MAVTITSDLGGITNFDIHGDPTTVGARWKKWKRSCELFVVGKGVQDAAQKKALLFHCGGPQKQDVYYTFPEAREPGEGETVLRFEKFGFNCNFEMIIRSLDVRIGSIFAFTAI